MSLGQFLFNNLMSGISIGGQYALVAIGYSMVYSILRLINFAHGDVFMLGGLFMVFATIAFPLWISIPLVILLITVLGGIVIETVAYKPLRTAPRMSVMISAIGVSYLIQNAALYFTGGLNRMFPQIPWISDTIVFLGASNRRVVFITPILLVILVFALMWLINKTKIGIGMRAAAKDFDTSQLMGIKINSVISITFIIGAFLAAIASVLFFTSFPAVFPLAGAMVGLKAFVAAVFGGIGSIPGAVIGGLLIGIVETQIRGLDILLSPIYLNIVSRPLGLAAFSDAFTFVLLILVLIFRPTGLFGDKPVDKV